MVAEIIPLGVLTRIYENIANNRFRKKIAQYFGLNIPVFTSWMTIVTLTRNTCCHHARLWNRFLSLRALTMTRPSTPWISNNVQQGRVFFTLCILKHFVDIIRQQNTFKHDLMALLEKYPMVDTCAMGFPVSWQNEPLWRWEINGRTVVWDKHSNSSEIFLAEKFVLSRIIRIFAAREPAKPLNDAQMCGSFLCLLVRIDISSLIQRSAYRFHRVSIAPLYYTNAIPSFIDKCQMFWRKLLLCSEIGCFRCSCSAHSILCKIGVVFQICIKMNYIKRDIETTILEALRKVKDWVNVPVAKRTVVYAGSLEDNNGEIQLLNYQHLFWHRKDTKHICIIRKNCIILLVFQKIIVSLLRIFIEYPQ